MQQCINHIEYNILGPGMTYKQQSFDIFMNLLSIRVSKEMMSNIQKTTIQRQFCMIKNNPSAFRNLIYGTEYVACTAIHEI